MSAQKITLEDVVAGLQDEGLLSDEQSDRSKRVLATMQSVQPWFVRAMVGFGAWLASLLLIGFVAGLSLALKGGYAVVGLGMIVAAIVVRKRFATDFMVQSTLAVSLAGQGLFFFGVSEFRLGGGNDALLSTIVIMSGVLFVVFPDRIHRVLSVLFATSAVAILLYMHKLGAIVPVIGPAFAAGLVLLYKQQPKLAASSMGALVRPFMTGLMLSAFGFLLLSTVYLLPELDIDFAFYPRPWISTLLFGALFLYLGKDVCQGVLGSTRKPEALVFYGLMVVVAAAAWTAPGLLLALIVVLLGATSGNRVFTGAGIVFLAIFLGAYFYGIQITMLTKSITLVATGTAVLVARWLILRVAAQATGGPANG